MLNRLFPSFCVFGERVREYIDTECSDCRCLVVGIEDTFVQHGSVSELFKEVHLDEDSVTEKVIRFVEKNK